MVADRRGTLFRVGSVALSLLATSCSGPESHPWGVGKLARPRAQVSGDRALTGTFEAGLSGFVHERISFDPDGCFHRLHGSDVGGQALEEHYERDGARVVLFDSPPPGSTRRQPRVEMRLVRWEPRLYLIEESQWLEFCNSINLGDEPRRTSSGPFLSRTSDWDRDVREGPELPDEWRDYVLPKVLYGKTIVGLEESAWIDLGADAGVKPGMRFVVRAVPLRENSMHFDAADFYADVTVVEPQRSLVRLRYGQSGRLTAGLEVCSRPFVMNADRVKPWSAVPVQADVEGQALEAKALVLETWSGLHYRTRFTLTRDGEALREGKQRYRKAARYAAACDRARFDDFARQAVELAARWEATAPSREGRWGADGVYSRLTIVAPDGNVTVVGTIDRNFDPEFVPLLKQIDGYVDELSWTELPGEPTFDR